MTRAFPLRSSTLILLAIIYSITIATHRAMASDRLLLMGKTVDARQRGIKNVVVSLFDSQSQICISSTKTDPSGHYQLKVHSIGFLSLEIRVGHPDYCSELFESTCFGTRGNWQLPELQLARGSPQQAQLLWADGTPAAGIPYVMTELGGNTGLAADSTTDAKKRHFQHTDKNGLANFRVRTRQYRIEARSNGQSLVNVLKYRTLKKPIMLSLAAIIPQRLNISLANGLPCDKATVHWRNSLGLGGQTTTNDRGLSTSFALPGDILTIKAEQMLAQRLIVPPAGSLIPEIRLERGILYSVKLQSDQRANQKLFVELEIDNRRWPLRWKDSEKSYISAPIPRNARSGTLHCFGFLSTPVKWQSMGTQVDLGTLELQSGNILQLSINSQGSNIAGAKVMLLNSEGRDFAFEQGPFTDDEGNLQIKALAAEIYHLKISSEGFENFQQHLYMESDRQLQIVLNPTAELSITVLGQDQRLVGSVEARIFWVGGSSHARLTHGGTLSFTNLPTGKALVVAVRSERARPFLKAIPPLQAGERRIHFAELDPGHELVIQVTTPEGKPIAATVELRGKLEHSQQFPSLLAAIDPAVGAKISEYLKRHSDSRIQTADSLGRTRFGGLKIGNYEIRVSDQNHFPLNCIPQADGQPGGEVVTLTENSSPVNILMKTAHVKTVKLVDALGQPVRHANIQLKLLQNPPFVLRPLPEGNGLYRFEGIPDGPLQLTIAERVLRYSGPAEIPAQFQHPLLGDLQMTLQKNPGQSIQPPGICELRAFDSANKEVARRIIHIGPQWKSFRIRSIPLTTTRLQLEGPQFLPASLRVKTQNGKLESHWPAKLRPRSLEIGLSPEEISAKAPRSTLELRLLTEEGGPASGLRVTTNRYPKPSRISSRHGKLTLKDTPIGSQTLLISDSEGLRNAIPIVILKPTESIDLRLAEPTKVDGTVLIDGQPLYGGGQLSFSYPSVPGALIRTRIGFGGTFTARLPLQGKALLQLSAQGVRRALMLTLNSHDLGEINFISRQLSGRLYQRDGTPCQGVQVTWIASNPSTSPAQSQYSDSNGKFLFPDLTTGDGQLHFASAPNGQFFATRDVTIPSDQLSISAERPYRWSGFGNPALLFSLRQFPHQALRIGSTWQHGDQSLVHPLNFRELWTASSTTSLDFFWQKSTGHGYWGQWSRESATKLTPVAGCSFKVIDAADLYPLISEPQQGQSLARFTALSAGGITCRPLPLTKLGHFFLPYGRWLLAAKSKDGQQFAAMIRLDSKTIYKNIKLNPE